MESINQKGAIILRMMNINFSFIVVALLALLTPLPAKTASPIQAPLYSDLSVTYGYYNGQRLSIERIQKDFPALAAEATKAQMKFNLVFKSSYENIEKMLKEMLGDKWDEYQIQMQEQAERVLGESSISAEQAMAFIKQVALRTKGDIESPVLETLLTYNPKFQKNPAEEFLCGFTHMFRTKHHPKAKGVDFQIQYPKSWLAKEGKRPNVIQLITSENGRGLDSIALMAKNLPLPANYKITDEELTNLFSVESLREMLPDRASFITAKTIVLDRRKGGMLIFEQIKQRLDITIKMRILQFITIYNNKMIFVQCGVVTTDKNANSLNERFKKMEPLFKLVGNSFVIQSQYYDGSSSELQASVNDGDIVSRESDISERRKTMGRVLGIRVLSIFINWVIGLFPAVFLRYVIFRRPIKKRLSYVISGIIGFLLFLLVAWVADSAGTRPNVFPVILWTALTYWIIHRGYVDETNENG